MQALIIRWGAILLAFLLAIGYGLWQRGSKESAYRALDTAQVEARGLRSELIAAHEVIETEREYAQRLQAIATRYEGDKNEIERQAAADVAALRDGNLKLQERWRSCTASLPGPSASPGEPHAGADDRSASAVRIVSAAAACDSQVRGLQAVVRADRGEAVDETP